MTRLRKRRIRLADNFPPEPQQIEFEELAPQRPQTRAECRRGPRPCPWVGCRWHFYLDVSARTGAIVLNFPDVDPLDMPCSCALDVIESGTATLENIGSLMNLTRERVRQIELIALAKMKQALKKIT